MSLVTLNDRAVRSVTTFGSVAGDSMVFIKKLTASSSGTLSFVNGSSDVVFDGTYKEYVLIIFILQQITLILVFKQIQEVTQIIIKLLHLLILLVIILKMDLLQQYNM